ncbi:MAG TPA: DUF2269 family protein [Saprospiraceae bacterium]|nr:DUF2269 family protein [Saprospiraceae bacterium]
MSTSSKISILNGLILLLITLADFTGIVHFELLISYQWHKLLHILGVVIFMGNMIVGPVWFSYAFYSKDAHVLKFAAKLLQQTDLYLTIPGVALTVLNGLCLSSVYGGSQSQPWLLHSIYLILTMWVLSVPLVFLQEKLFLTIETEAQNEAKINRLLIRWSILGSLVMIPPSIIFYWMVVKPV